MHRAVDKRGGALVAIKVLPASSDSADICKEIEMLRACRSDYIVSYYGAAQNANQLWIVMEAAYVALACTPPHTSFVSFADVARRSAQVPSHRFLSTAARARFMTS